MVAYGERFGAFARKFDVCKVVCAAEGVAAYRIYACGDDNMSNGFIALEHAVGNVPGAFEYRVLGRGTGVLYQRVVVLAVHKVQCVALCSEGGVIVRHYISNREPVEEGGGYPGVAGNGECVYLKVEEYIRAEFKLCLAACRNRRERYLEVLCIIIRKCVVVYVLHRRGDGYACKVSGRHERASAEAGHIAAIGKRHRLKAAAVKERIVAYRHGARRYVAFECDRAYVRACKCKVADARYPRRDHYVAVCVCARKCALAYRVYRSGDREVFGHGLCCGVIYKGISLIKYAVCRAVCAAVGHVNRREYGVVCVFVNEERVVGIGDRVVYAVDVAARRYAAVYAVERYVGQPRREGYRRERRAVHERPAAYSQLPLCSGVAEYHGGEVEAVCECFALDCGDAFGDYYPRDVAARECQAGDHVNAVGDGIAARHGRRHVYGAHCVRSARRSPVVEYAVFRNVSCIGSVRVVDVH